MPKYQAVGYIRLSYTKNHSEESDSVTNQKKLIREFISGQPGIELVSEQVDDGYCHDISKKTRSALHSKRKTATTWTVWTFSRRAVAQERNKWAYSTRSRIFLKNRVIAFRSCKRYYNARISAGYFNGKENHHGTQVR